MNNQLFNELVELVNKVRKECPWDAKQTFETLRPLFIEEVYEAVASENNIERCDELGDVLFHILLQCAILQEQNNFTIDNVVQNILAKLKDRHPEIALNKPAPNLDQQINNWHSTKLKSESGYLLDKLKSLATPALIRANRIQKKVATVGFDWDNKTDVIKKIYEELNELENAKTESEIEEEFGDFLFSVVNYSRFINVDPEIQLQNACNKFINRFNKLEDEMKLKNKKFGELNLNQLDKIWNEVKKNE
ncbi:MAG: nucleoside triphosphate pyrophosphohydrolase [Bacteroidetes bacterium]|nr:nucleoside triphosphate pyrophosphohydrolase [Bacteroidota bacterium]